MTAPMAGGRRRVDRVLDPEFVADLAGTDLRTLSAKRLDAEQEEVDLSYVRRLIQGRVDIATAEQQRRLSGSTESLVDQLASILADDNSSTTGSGRHLNAQPSRTLVDVSIAARSNMTLATMAPTMAPRTWAGM